MFNYYDAPIQNKILHRCQHSAYRYRRLQELSAPQFADGKPEIGYSLVAPPMKAIKQDCIEKCDSLKECNNIAFIPEEDKCYLRSNIISITAPQVKLKDGYTLFKDWKPGEN